VPGRDISPAGCVDEIWRLLKEKQADKRIKDRSTKKKKAKYRQLQKM
jgi:hypothetical protein